MVDMKINKMGQEMITGCGIYLFGHLKTGIEKPAWSVGQQIERRRGKKHSALDQEGDSSQGRRGEGMTSSDGGSRVGPERDFHQNVLNLSLRRGKSKSQMSRGETIEKRLDQKK